MARFVSEWSCLDLFRLDSDENFRQKYWYNFVYESRYGGKYHEHHDQSDFKKLVGIAAQHCFFYDLKN